MTDRSLRGGRISGLADIGRPLGLEDVRPLFELARVTPAVVVDVVAFVNALVDELICEYRSLFCFIFYFFQTF